MMKPRTRSRTTTTPAATPPYVPALLEEDVDVLVELAELSLLVGAGAIDEDELEAAEEEVAAEEEELPLVDASGYSAANVASWSEQAPPSATGRWESHWESHERGRTIEHAGLDSVVDGRQGGSCSRAGRDGRRDLDGGGLEHSHVRLAQLEGRHCRAA